MKVDLESKYEEKSLKVKKEKHRKAKSEMWNGCPSLSRLIPSFIQKSESE